MSRLCLGCVWLLDEEEEEEEEEDLWWAGLVFFSFFFAQGVSQPCPIMKKKKKTERGKDTRVAVSRMRTTQAWQANFHVRAFQV